MRCDVGLKLKQRHRLTGIVARRRVTTSTAVILTAEDGDIDSEFHVVSVQ